MTGHEPRGDGGRLAPSEAAAAHSGADPCPGGWKLRSAADVEALQASLALSAEQPRADFRAVEVAGTA
jgi:hypothetical protein